MTSPDPTRPIGPAASPEPMAAPESPPEPNPAHAPSVNDDIRAELVHPPGARRILLRDGSIFLGVAALLMLVAWLAIRALTID